MNKNCIMQTIEFSQPILVITGMHRSGTSLVASLLQSAGVDIGKRLMGGGETNLKGHFEDLDFVEFHESVLRSQGISTEGWTLERSIQVQEQYLDKAKSLIQGRLSQPLWGWKDPRTTLFLQFWQKLLPEATFVFVYRAPWQVIDSLYRRGDQVFKTNPNFALDLWMNYNQAIIAFYDEFPEKCVIFNSETITSKPDLLTEIIEKELKIDFRRESGSDIYEEKLFNSQISSSHRPTLVKQYFPEAFELYQELNRRAKPSEPESSLFTGKEFSEFPSYKAWVLQDWLDVQTKERELNRSQAEVERIQAQLQQTQAELELTKSKLQQTQADLIQAKATIIAMESSKFWKLRKVWFSLKQTLGLTNPATATALERLKFWQQTGWRSQPGGQSAEEPPIPPPHLIHFVTGSYDTSWFLKSGALAAQSIRDTLEKNGLQIENFSSILDFGCGVGRAIRYWNRLEKTAVYGTDYNPDLIEWCKKNLTFAHFQTNNLVGRLEYEDEQFDFIYALSVFTHLTEANQFFWIEELTRILQPGGYLLITTHGESCTSHLFTEGRELFNQGQLVVYGGEQEGTNVCAAFHPQRYVQEKLAKNLIVVDFIPAGALGNPPQDVYLLKKPLAD